MTAKLLIAAAALLSLSVPLAAAEEPTIEEAYEYDNFTNVDNYLASKETSVSKTDDGLTFDGTISYKTGFNFEQNTDHKIKLKFNIEEIAETGEAWIIFHENPNDLLGCADNEIPGYYIRLKNNHFTSWTFDAFYTDGINYSAEMLGTTFTTKGDIRRDHTIQFETSLVQGYTEGVRCFYHGQHYGDWLGYSRVKNRNITDDSNLVYLSMGGCKMTITNIVSLDVVAPKITYTPASDEYGYSNEEYVFGDISVYDEIDKEVPYSYKLLDTDNKDITNKTYFNNDGKLCFSPIVSGEYTFRISANDYSSNAASKRVYITILNRPHYPLFVEDPNFSISGRRGQKYYFPVPHAEDITDDDLEKDNNITYEYSGYYYDDANKYNDIEVSKDENGYYFMPDDYEAYLTDGVGQYFLRIKASNKYGSTFVEKSVWVKYALNDVDAFDMTNLNNRRNWSSAKYMKFSEDKVGVGGETYYKAGLPLEKGIKINFSIDNLGDKSQTDCWFSLSFLKHPGQARYGDRKCGLYFMFFYQSGALRYNLQYVLDNGDYLDIKNNEALYSTIPNELELEITPFDITLDPNMDDNIEGLFDNTKIDSFEIYKVLRSELEDDEGFVYLSCGCYRGGVSVGNDFDTTNNPKYYINKIINTDKTAPEISLKGNIPESETANKEITLPEAVGLDETDGEIEASLLSVTRPDGKGITVINKKFVPIYNGTYTITYIATDKSGNATELVKTIQITGGKDINGEEKKGCSSSIISSTLLISLLSFAGIGLIEKRKRR